MVFDLVFGLVVCPLNICSAITASQALFGSLFQPRSVGNVHMTESTSHVTRPFPCQYHLPSRQFAFVWTLVHRYNLPRNWEWEALRDVCLSILTTSMQSMSSPSDTSIVFRTAKWPCTTVKSNLYFLIIILLMWMLILTKILLD